MNGDYVPQHLQQASHPSWTTVIRHEDHDDDDYDDPDDPRSHDQDKVRRRSSKACDQCRKNKCKCERTGSINDPCRNCVLLNTECTFLGPSRKRGPPKGYIDAIENRLHQVEALLGAFVNSSDPRAVSLLRDISVEPSAREIVERVTLSPYGSKARKKKDAIQGEPTHSRGKAGEVYTGRLQPFDRPIPEWQELIGKRISDATSGRLARGGSIIDGAEVGGLSTRDTIRRRTENYNPVAPQPAASASALQQQQQQLQQSLNGKQSLASLRSTGRESDDSAPSPNASDDDDLTPGFGQLSLNEHEQFRYHGKVSGLHILGRHRRLDRRNEGGVWRFPAPNVYVGQGMQTAVDHMVTHPSSFGLQASPQPQPAILDKSHVLRSELERDIRKRLPNRDIQEHLLHLFWVYVHPVLPVLDKDAVMEAWTAEANAAALGAEQDVAGQDAPTVGDSPPQQSDAQSRGEKSPSPYLDAPDVTGSQGSQHGSSPQYMSGDGQFHHQARVPLLLLLAIFSISARFSTRSPPVPPDPNQVWDAGDSAVADRYLAAARTLLNHTYSSSRPSTCQALLLLSYREIGVGAMAAAWLYTGMAVRMAQDLGMHRKAERWAWKTPDGGRFVFTQRERQVRKKIWYGCVIMDKYVSTYIGRPLSIFDRDFDTPLPNEQESEETEMWIGDSSDPVLDEEGLHSGLIRTPVQSHLLSCFNQSAKLSAILSGIVSSIYSVHPAASRHTEYTKLEEKLDKWLLELPLHLSLDKFQHQHQQQAAAKAKAGTPLGPDGICDCPPPAPHIFTLHMHYWCTVLLLHRPFIRVRSASSHASNLESVLSHGSEKSFDLCMAAASHITSIVSLFAQHHCLLRCPAFFTYYIFSAGIMYVTALTIQSDHPQAGLGLQRCMDILKRMDRTWSSAGRQWELLQGSQLDLREAELLMLQQGGQRNKRAADETLDNQVTSLSHTSRSTQAIQPSRLVTNFVVPSNEMNGTPRSAVSALDSASTHGGLYQTPSQTAARPYHLGLDYGSQSPSSVLNPTFPPQRSLFPQFERWFTPDSQVRNYPPTSQQAAFSHDAQLDASISISQIPRLPVSSARMPYWNEYDEPSMMGSSLYNIPLLSGAAQPVNIQASSQNIFGDTEYATF